MPTLQTQEREILHREVRDQDPDVWEPACHRLGELAASDQSAYAALCELLLSSLPELRLKGLVALRIMAPAKPEEVLAFLNDRVAEARVDYDPVMLDATFFVFAALPKELGQKAVRDYLQDESEAVRAAAAAALPFWSSWQESTILNLAHDSSVLVRAGLITALLEMEKAPGRSLALEALRRAADPELEALLQDFSQEFPPDPPLPVREPYDRGQASELLSHPKPPPVTVARFERWLVENPEVGLGMVRERLEKPGAGTLLRQLAELCRDRSLGALFHAWSRILFRQDATPPENLVLEVLGILDHYPDSVLLAPLREFVKACALATECESSLDMATWSCTRQVTAAALALWNPATMQGLSLAPEAQRWLEEMARISGEFQDVTLFQLSHLTSELVNMGCEIESDCPRPERDLLQMVVDRWQHLVRQELDDMMGGSG